MKELTNSVFWFHDSKRNTQIKNYQNVDLSENLLSTAKLMFNEYSVSNLSSFWIYRVVTFDAATLFPKSISCNCPLKILFMAFKKLSCTVNPSCKYNLFATSRVYFLFSGTIYSLLLVNISFSCLLTSSTGKPKFELHLNSNLNSK